MELQALLQTHPLATKLILPVLQTNTTMDMRILEIRIIFRYMYSLSYHKTHAPYAKNAYM